MWYGILLGVLGAFFFMAVSVSAVQSVRGIMAWHRKNGQAAARANIAATEIQKMLSGRTRPLINGQQ